MAAEMNTTKSGLLRTLEITSFLPGRRIPDAYCKAANEGGPWFFIPTWWSDDNYWGGFATIYLSQVKFPFPYSPGFQDEEAALAQAEQWEEDLQKRGELGRLSGDPNQRIATSLERDSIDF
jgi:hypothetical protein